MNLVHPSAFCYYGMTFGLFSVLIKPDGLLYNFQTHANSTGGFVHC